jgi:hypothetical protein
VLASWPKTTVSAIADLLPPKALSWIEHPQEIVMNNNNLESFQKIGQQNMDKALKILGEWHEGWRAISTEMTDFTKRSFDEGAATVEKLLSAKSFDQAVAIQSDFAKRTFDGYVHELSRIGSLYAQLFRNSYEPVEGKQYSAQRK